MITRDPVERPLVKRRAEGSSPSPTAKHQHSFMIDGCLFLVHVDGRRIKKSECDECSRASEHEKTMEAARKAQVGLSKGENGKKRKASVERYLYQFMHGHGTTVSRAYKDNWDRIFGKKKEPEDFDEGGR